MEKSRQGRVRSLVLAGLATEESSDCPIPGCPWMIKAE